MCDPPACSRLEAVSLCVTHLPVPGWRLRGMKGWDKVLSVLGEAEGVARKLLDDHEVNLMRHEAVRSTLTLRHQAQTTRFARQRLRNHCPSSISTLSTCCSRTASGVICYWSKPFPAPPALYPRIPRHSRSRADVKVPKKPSKVWRQSSSSTTLYCKA